MRKKYQEVLGKYLNREPSYVKEHIEGMAYDLCSHMGAKEAFARAEEYYAELDDRKKKEEYQALKEKWAKKLLKSRVCRDGKSSRRKRPKVYSRPIRNLHDGGSAVLVVDQVYLSKHNFDHQFRAMKDAWDLYQHVPKYWRRFHKIPEDQYQRLNDALFDLHEVSLIGDRPTQEDRSYVYSRAAALRTFLEEYEHYERWLAHQKAAA